MSAGNLVARVRERALQLAAPGGLRRCATTQQLEATEKVFGFALHEFHRELLLRVADGGFGPGPNGIYGLASASALSGDETCVSAWRELGGHDTSVMPADTVPLTDLGCACWVLVHATSPAGTMRHTASDGVYEISQGIGDFFAAWLDGSSVHEMLHDQARAVVKQGINPFTKQPMHFRGEGPPLGRLILPYSLPH